MEKQSINQSINQSTAVLTNLIQKSDSARMTVTCLCLSSLSFTCTRLYFIPDQTLIIEGSPVRRVFYAAVDKEKMNYYEAKRLCDMLGAILASLEQLTAAQAAGLNQCK